MPSLSLFPNLLSVCTINKLESIVSVSSNANRTSKKDQRINKILDMWHMQLGHLNVFDLRKTLSAFNISFGNKMSELSICKPCQFGEQHRLSFKSSKTYVALKIIHNNFWVLLPQLQIKIKSIILVFID